MLVTPFENKMLNLWLRNVAAANVGDASGLQPSATAGSLYFAGHTAWPGEAPASQQVSEAAYTGYARGACARGAGFGAASNGVINLAAAVSLGIRTDNGATVVIPYWSLGFAASGATEMHAWGVFGDATFGARAFMCDDATADTILVPAHGLVADDRIAFFDIESGGALPGGVTEGTVYWVRSTGLTTDRFTVSATQGGASIAISSLGSGIATKVVPLQVNQNTDPQLSTATLIRLS
jgi:hypothetical protein